MPGQWVDEGGNNIDFDFLEEKVVAKGTTLRQLANDIERYAKLNKLTI